MKPKLLSKKQARRLQFRNDKLLETSRNAYATAVRHYFRYLVEHGLSDDFDIESIRAWISGFRNSNTFNTYLQGVKSFYYKQFEQKAAVQRLKMRESFESIRRIKTVKAKVYKLDYLPQSDINKLAAKTTERISCIINALFWTGCRITELINIRLADCHMQEAVLIKIIGKGNKERYVHLPLSEYKRIVRVFKPKEYLFENKNGSKFNRSHLSKEIKRQAQQRCCLDVHAHTLRHSKAMYLKNKGMSADMIARALGHSDVTTTLSYYLHGTPGAKEQGIPREKTG